MRIFNTRSLLPILIIVIGFGCVKDPQDIPPGLTGNPVFGIKGQFGNEAIDIQAGIDQWTFIPVVDDLDSFHIYSAVLSQDGCIDRCPSSWTFNFYQVQLTNATEEEIFTNTIKEGPVDFVLADTERDSFNVSISTHPDLFMNGVSFWGNPGGTDIVYENEFKETVGGDQIFDACFQSVIYAGCQYQQCVYFKPSTIVPCLVHLEAVIENGHYVVLTAVPDGTGPFHIQWDDGPSTSSLVVYVGSSQQNIYANVRVTDANGNRAELEQTVLLQDSVIDACYYPIHISSMPFTDHSAALAAGDAEIIFRDQDGEEWKSTQLSQPDESTLHITSVEYFDLSPTGLRAYKTRLSIHVLLTNASGESRWFDADDVVLPLAHPE